METVVCNASPLISLAKADLLEILPREFAAVLVPTAAREEIRAGPSSDPMAALVDELTWLEHVELMPPLTPLAVWQLGPGESEVIEYARQHHGAIALLDDKNARKAAVALHIPVLGTLGLVARAASHGHLSSFEEAATRLKDAGLYLDEGVIQAVRQGLEKHRR